MKNLEREFERQVKKVYKMSLYQQTRSIFSIFEVPQPIEISVYEMTNTLRLRCAVILVLGVDNNGSYFLG